MTSVRFATSFAALVLFVGCADEKPSSFQLTTEGSGGAANSTASEATGGSALVTATGGTTMTSTAATTGGTSTNTTAVAPAVTRCSGASTGEVTLVHTASPGQPNSLVGATKVTIGSAASFKASDLDLKFCFSVVGSVTLTSATGMSVDSASISGGTVNYINLSATTRTLETTNEANRYCIVFDVGSATEASGVTVSGATAVTYNWRFNEKSVDVGLVFDPRPKNAPELTAVLNGSVAACQVVSS